jgi:hypothetical protein
MALSERGDFASARADLDAAVALYTETDDYRPGDAYAARGMMFLPSATFPRQSPTTPRQLSGSLMSRRSGPCAL